jgi:hypothetical protein
MKRWLLGLMLLCLLGPGPAAAETWTEDYETQFGTLTLQKEGQFKSFWPGVLLLNRNKIDDFISNIGILRIINWGERGDVIILSLDQGYDIVHLTKDGHKRIGKFAHHGYNPSDFKVTPDEISFRLERNFPADIDHWIVHYNGDYPIIETIMEDDSGIAMAGAGADVTRWAGVRAYEVLEDASERLRFRTIIGDDDLNHLRTSLQLSQPMEETGGFLTGWGCWPHLCGPRPAFLALEVATGKPYAAYVMNCQLITFGAPLDKLPAALLAQIDQAREYQEHWTDGRETCQQITNIERTRH